jgi:hypothetical protein
MPTGTVTFTSSPAGAAIWVDGADSGYVTPRDLSLDYGARAYILKLSGYQDYSGTVTVSATPQTVAAYLSCTSIFDIIRARLYYVLNAINTAQALGYEKIHKFKPANWPIPKNIAIISVEEVAGGHTAFNTKMHHNQSTFRVVLQAYWGTVAKDYTGWAAMEQKALELRQALNCGLDLLTTSQSTLSPTVYIDDCWVNECMELFDQSDPNFPRGHQLTLTIQHTQAWTRT